jgi:polysaccharide pyruvyl transferase WcaK-like protein
VGPVEPLDPSAPRGSPRVGLISPYTGTNLGDQAIHIACIENLRSRCPAISFTAICLNPTRVASLHKIAAFPLTGLSVPFYSGSNRRAPARGNVVRKGARAIRNALVAPLNAICWLAKAWRLVHTLDALIVAGGGQLDDEWGGSWGHPCSLFCWALLARLRGKPFLLLSVGFCQAKSALSRVFLRRALQIAAYISCRDQGSIAQIGSSLGQFSADFVPDLACSLPFLRNYAEPEKPTAGPGISEAPLIVVSPIAFGRSGSWPTEADDMYRRYIRELAGFSADLLVRGFRLRVIITSSPDVPAIDDLMAAIRAAAPPNNEERIAAVEIFSPATAETLCALLAQAHCVIISRLHGVMLSQLLLRPVLAISFDRKVDVQMAQSRQDAFLSQIQTVTHEELKLLFDQVLATHDQVREGLRHWSETSRNAVQNQFDATVQLLAS